MNNWKSHTVGARQKAVHRHHNLQKESTPWKLSIRWKSINHNPQY